MRISTQNGFLLQKKGIFELIDILKNAGYDYIDFSFYCISDNE